MKSTHSTFFEQFNNHPSLNRIKLIILFQLWFITLVFGQKNHHSNRFTIEGSIQHFGSGLLIGTITDSATQSVRLDTIVVHNNSFKHNGQIEETQIVKYKAIGDRFAKYRKLVKGNDTVQVDLAEDKSRNLELVVSLGLHIKVAGIARTYLDAYPSGTDENERLAKLNRKLYPLYNEIGDLKTQYNKATYDSLSRRENLLLAQIDNFESKFVEKHPSSIVTSSIIFEKFKLLNGKDPVKADSLYNLIQTFKKDFYHQQIIALKRMRTENDINISIGDLFPSFQSKMVYGGNNVSSEQLLGKYTVIDFWGSWCVPCIKEMPKLMEYYTKFRDKLNIVSVANDQYQNWKTFLDKNKYPWIQILDQEVPKLSDRLKVTVYPTKYLLDPNGKVVEIFTDSNEQIWKALDDLFRSP